MAVDLAVLDSCVIYPVYLRDTLLRAVEVGLYDVYWSQEILDGATRNLVKNGVITDLQAVRLQAMMNLNFPEAMVEVPDELVQVMTNHPGDRHVAAAALVANAKVIVTFNLKHFPAESLTPWGISAMHPDLFLTNLYEKFPDNMAKVIRQQSQDLRKPPLTVPELLDRLTQQVPEFVNKVRQHF